MSSIEVSAGGKLMIAGEYSVLRPGGSAIALAVPGDLSVSIDSAGADASEHVVSSDALELQRTPLGHDPRLIFIQRAVEAVERATVSVSENASAWHIVVRGRLGQLGGPKLGLGSSAAVVAATVGAAWWARTGRPLHDATSWTRLAHWAHNDAQGKLGSGYDVATIVAGQGVSPGVPVAVRYAPPSMDRLRRPPSPEWIDADWPEMQVARLAWPTDLNVRVIWTGEGADTRKLIAAVGGGPTADHLEALQSTARAVASAWESDAASRICQALAATQAAFEAWGESVDAPILTPRVRRALGIVADVGAVGRVSGAGGGDCILAFSTEPQQMALIESRAKLEGFWCGSVDQIAGAHG